MIGQTVSHYKILEKLGEGGMGVVYKAEDTKLRRIVALKFLPQHLTSTEEERARFLQEAQAAATLNHPNICTIHAIEEFEGRQFIDMEFVDGMTLRKKLPVENPSVYLNYAVQIGDALAEAHSKGIVHRDIKSDNVMIGAKNQIKVTDFGLAKLKGSLKLTRTSSTIGTLAYMAPEQIRGGEVDARSDIFSFGILLFEMITGKTPFRGEHDAAMMYSILNEEPDSLLKIKGDVSPDLDRIVKRAIEKDPEDRYQHVDDMASELRRIQKQSSRISRTSIDVAPPVKPEREKAGPVPDQTKTVVPRRVKSPWIYALIAAVLAIPGYFLFLKSSKTLDSLAVLPFVNVSADPNTEYLSDGMTESLINNLTSIPELRVVPRSTVFRFKGKDIDPLDVGKTLHVAAVLSGRVVQRGDDLSVQLDLVDVQNQSQIWGEQYHRKASEVIPLQEEIVREVTRKLQLTLSGEAKIGLAKRSTENPDAYKLYLQGRFYWNRRRGPELVQAADYFRQAIAVDPNYALAYAGLADCYLIMEQYSAIPGREVFPKAEEAARKALELDKSLGEAHASLAMARMDYWDWDGAEREFKTSIALSPKYPTAYHWYGLLLAREVRLDESFAYIHQALDLDPLSPIILLNVAIAFDLAKKDTASALQYYQKVIDLDPNFIPAYYQRARMFLHHGNPERGLPDALKAVEISQRAPEPLSELAFCLAQTGKSEEALAVAREMEALYDRHACAAYLVAKGYAGLGDRQKVFQWLQKDYSDHTGWLSSLKLDFEWDRFRDDPRFTELLKNIGLNRAFP